jgi:hypothetical protein
MELVLGVVIMAIPKIILFYYCHFQLNKVLNIQNPNISSPTNSLKNLTHAMQTNITSQNTLPFTDKNNEEEIYLQIYEELENKTFDKALWIRLFAETDGDENKTKVQYVRARFSILNSTKQQTSKVIVETNISNDYVSAPKEISINSIDNFAYYPFEQSLVIDTEKKFNVDREIAKKILLLGIKKYHGGFLYKQQSFHSFKNLTFGTLEAAIKYAEKNPST